MSHPLNLYLAAVYTNNYMPGGTGYNALLDSEKELVEKIKHHNILESYHYVNKQKFVDNMRDNGAKVFLDSGAFSAFFSNVNIDIQKYIRYIHENKDIIRVEDGDLLASVLDGIGDPLKTYQNQCIMEKGGVRPLPCFHYGEDPRYLEHYVKNYSYITLGGMVPISNKQLYYWLDEIWERYLIDSSGNAKIKVHGFGLTSFPLMERYPWYSCDSSSWIQAASFGAIVSDKHGPLHVSSESPNRHKSNQHITTLSELERQKVEQGIIEYGFNPERLSTVYQSRAIYNLHGYIRIQDKINKDKRSHNDSFTQGLF